MRSLLAQFWPTGRGAYRVSRFLRGRIPRAKWNDVFTTPDGLHLQLDLATYPDCPMAWGLYELDTARCLWRLLKPGSWFVDCGANLGYFTLLAARRVGSTGRVDAFEPQPENRARLFANIQRNQLAHIVRVHDCAVGEQAGEANLFQPAGNTVNHGQATLFPVSGAAITRTQIVRLDEALEPGRVPDVIKLDIEGAEQTALRGAGKLLAADRPPALIVEHNPASAMAAGTRAEALFELLRDLQPCYQLYQLGLWRRRIGSAAQLKRLQREVNLLAVCSRSYKA